MTQKYRDISLYLNDIRELFSQPEVDLAARNLVFSPGIDTIVSRLRPTSLIKPTRLTLYLPLEKLSAATVEQIKAVIEQYCRFKQGEIDNNLGRCALSCRWKQLMNRTA